MKTQFGTNVKQLREKRGMDQKELGHSSPTITLQVYAHMMPNDDDKLLNIMNKK